MNKSNDITKLPKWAQREIDRLQKNIEYAQNNNLDTRQFDNDIVIGYNELGFIRRNCPILVPMYRSGKATADIVIRVAYDDWKKAEYLDINGGDSIIIEPRAANSIRIKFG